MQYYYDNDNRGGRQFLAGVPEVTRNLIIINLIVFVATLINKNFMVGTFGLFYPSSPHFHVWQYVTHMFMHGGFFHILFNMYALYCFGSVVERMIGPRKFLWLYFVAGFGAVALHLGTQYLEVQTLMQQIEAGSAGAASSLAAIKATPTVGASGAIYGVLIAYAMLFPASRLTLIFPPISLSARTWVIIFAVIELLTGINGAAPDVAHFAHLGGMLFGWLLMRWWKKRYTLFDRN